MKGKSSPVIIGTRGSELALWQANFTKSILEKNGLIAELKIIKTKGDATQQWNLSFDKIEGKGFFTKELEDALLANEIDLAVHSCKDLPTDFPDGLTIAAYSKRANPFDSLIIRKESLDNSGLLKLKQNAIVGTSSARRKAQLAALRSDIKLQDLRGNVPTRIQKLRDGNYDAIVLASAGFERLQLDLSEFEILELKAPMFIPAPAQGVLAFQIRINDEAMHEICKLLNENTSTQIASIERQILHDFEGGCQMPLGVYAESAEHGVDLWISQAASSTAIPKRMHKFVENDIIDNNKWIELSIKWVAHLKAITPQSVFISSDLRKDDYLVTVLRAHQYEVNFQSLIEFKPVEFVYPQDANWLFFSSKNGVHYFFKEQVLSSFNSTIKIAAINQGTALALRELGFDPDFIGSGGNLDKIAADFDQLADGKIVFPQAKKSMQSIQKKLAVNRDVHSLIVYENTAKTNVSKRNEKILIFTSPLSIEAYFTQNQIDDCQEIISIGNTTSRKLADYGISNVRTAFEPSPWSLLDEVFSL